MRTLLITVAAAVAAFAASAVNPLDLPRLHAQSAATNSAAFEVASVKKNNSGEGFIKFGMQPGGRFNAINAPVRELIRFAYQVQNFQLEGGPSWINAERFDIIAKAEGDVPPSPPGGPPGPMQMMMRALLADRFKLVVHNETKEMPIYALVLARPDGKLGSRIDVSTVDCAAMAAARRGGGPPPAPPQPGERPPCGMMMGPGSLVAGSASMSQLAQALSPRVNRVIIDKTGLTGQYGLNLDFTPDQMPNMPLGAPPPGAPPLPPIDPNGPSLFTALQEQLGLKLESQRGPVETLVIDSIEHPTED